jgi:hypothetical protein
MICGGGQSAGFELLCLLLLLLYCISPIQSGLLLFIIFCLTMAKRPASSSVESQIKKRAKKGTTSSATPNLDNLHKTRDAGKKKHMFAEGTDGNYTGHLDRGSRFLARWQIRRIQQNPRRKDSSIETSIPTKWRRPLTKFQTSTQHQCLNCSWSRSA